MKAKYMIKHQRHEVYKVNCNGRIILEALNVEKFAMKLQMSDPMPPVEPFRGEAIRKSEQLKGRRGFDVKLSGLIDNQTRVTFVTAIAGMGKSVLVKEMTFKWAKGELFDEFNVFTFECRELNDFALHKGKRFGKDELIVEFLKDKFGFYVKDSKYNLFIVDGFDKLYDSSENDSIICQLLDLEKSKFIESRMIITGRPHSVSNLLKHGKNMGHIREVEIIGLSNEQVDEYIHKFASSDEEVAKIKEVIDSSKSIRKLSNFPQFLNSICCVALLSNETQIKDAAELYCWLCYLLFRQHADEDRSPDKDSHKIFKEYSKLLLELSKICHELLDNNSIIFEGNTESLFGNIGKGKEFLSSFFVDASDEFNERKQFMHPNLMDFLAAIYVFTAKENDEIIKDILKKRSYQVLLFYCQLMSGLMYKGVIKNLFINALKLEESDARSFFCNILKLVRECVDDHDDESFKLSVDVIMCLMKKDAISKNVILSIVNELRFKYVGSNSSHRKLIEMLIKPLIVEFKCLDDELKEAFKNVHFGMFNVNDLNELKYAKYLGSVHWIKLNGGIAEIATTVRGIQKEIDGSNEEVKRVCISKCKLDHKESDDKIAKSSKLELLQIYNCSVTKEGFFYLCKWMITVEGFELDNIKEMEGEWWNVLVDVIENAKKNDGDLALKDLEISDCPLMNDEIKKKVITFILIHNYSS